MLTKTLFAGNDLYNSEYKNVIIKDVSLVTDGLGYEETINMEVGTFNNSSMVLLKGSTRDRTVKKPFVVYKLLILPQRNQEELIKKFITYINSRDKEYSWELNNE